jgi:hypothetical protein
MHVKLKIDDFSSATVAATVQSGRSAQTCTHTLECLSLVRFAHESIACPFSAAGASCLLHGISLWNTADGEVVGEFLKVRLASRFVPVVMRPVSAWCAGQPACHCARW